MGKYASREILKQFNENENTTYQNPQDVSKAVLREKHTVLNAHQKKINRNKLIKKNPKQITQTSIL